MNLTQQTTRKKIQPKVLIQLITDAGLVNVYETVDSGTVITREKIDTVTQVFHPGIIIGTDEYGQVWVAHNHYSYKKPVYEVLEEYLIGKSKIKDYRRTDYNRTEIVQRTIREVEKGKEYKKLSYNCQTFVNLIVRGEQSSEAVDKISDGAMIFGGILGLVGLFTGNKTALAAGAAIVGIGATAKGISKRKL